jgi:lipopolysaccharide export system protein LptA
MKKPTLISFTILKWIPRLLLLGVVGFSAYVWWNYGKKADEDKPAAIDKRAQRVIQKVSGIEYSHFDKGQKVYEVHAQKNEKMRNQSQQLQKPVFVFFDDKQRENIRVTGNRCNISRDFNTITVIDDVVVKSPNGMTVTSHLMKYDSRLRQFFTSSPARFHWKTLTGRAKGFVYKIEDEMLILPEEPEIQYINTSSDNKVPIIVTGSRGAIDRKTGFAYFDEEVQVKQGKDQINADRIEVNFKPGGNDLEKIVARNNVHVKFAKPGQKDEEEADADKNGAPPVISTVATNPSDKIQANAPSMSNVFTADQESGKELSADTVELYFYDDGNTIRSFQSDGNCTFILHTFDKNGKPFENRIIKGQRFDAKFNGIGDMEQFHAKENVSVDVLGVGPNRKANPPQTIYCEEMNTFFIPQSGDVREIHFEGGFKHVQNDRTVSSQSAVYYGNEKKTDLIGTPRINDASMNITSDKMLLMEENSAIHADGNVKSEFSKTARSKGPTTFPFSSPSNEPVYISAEKMDWDSTKSEATYTGKAKLWQEKNVITAAKMIINDKENTMSAYDKVHTIFYNGKSDVNTADKTKKKDKKSAQTQTAPQTAPSDENKLMDTDESGEDGPIVVDASIMNYAEKDRIIHFEKNVHVTTPSTKINSDKTDFFLKEQSSEFDRLYAQGSVTIQNEQKHATGQQATFYEGERKLILSGNPRLQESGKADIVGHVLTLFLADGRILIDGQEDGRATSTIEMLQGSPLAPKNTTPPKKVPDAGSKDRKPNQEL